MAASSTLRLGNSCLQKMLECPVCLEIAKVPKVLSCGHNLCVNCEQIMISRRGSTVSCPVCRIDSQVPLGGLPTNYSMSDLIAHLAQSESENRYVCSVCPNRGSADKMFRCNCISVVVCSLCAVKMHTGAGHNLSDLKQLLDDRRRTIGQWRDQKTKTYDSILAKASDLVSKRRDILRESRSFIQFLNAGVTKKINSLTNETKKQFDDFKAELDRFVAADETNQNFNTDVTVDCDRHNQSMTAVGASIQKVTADASKCIEIMRDATKEMRAVLGLPQVAARTVTLSTRTSIKPSAIRSQNRPLFSNLQAFSPRICSQNGRLALYSTESSRSPSPSRVSPAIAVDDSELLSDGELSRHMTISPVLSFSSRSVSSEQPLNIAAEDGPMDSELVVALSSPRRSSSPEIQASFLVSSDSDDEGRQFFLMRQAGNNISQRKRVRFDPSGVAVGEQVAGSSRGGAMEVSRSQPFTRRYSSARPRINIMTPWNVTEEMSG